MNTKRFITKTLRRLLNYQKFDTRTIVVHGLCLDDSDYCEDDCCIFISYVNGNGVSIYSVWEFEGSKIIEVPSIFGQHFSAGLTCFVDYVGFNYAYDLADLQLFGGSAYIYGINPNGEMVD